MRAGSAGTTGIRERLAARYYSTDAPGERTLHGESRSSRALVSDRMARDADLGLARGDIRSEVQHVVLREADDDGNHQRDFLARARAVLEVIELAHQVDR